MKVTSGQWQVTRKKIAGRVPLATSHFEQKL